MLCEVATETISRVFTGRVSLENPSQKRPDQHLSDSEQQDNFLLHFHFEHAVIILP